MASMSVFGFGPRSGASRSFLLRSTEHVLPSTPPRSALLFVTSYGLRFAAAASLHTCLTVAINSLRLDGWLHLARGQCSPGLVLGRTLKGPLADGPLAAGTLSLSALREKSVKHGSARIKECNSSGRRSPALRTGGYTAVGEPRPS
jgi:hypothetical protein